MFARRMFGAAAFFGFIGVAIVLLLSDRIGASFGDVITSVTRAGRAVERDAGVNLIDRSDIPGRTDQIGHAVFWGSGMLLLGWIARRKLPVVLTAMMVGGLSVAFELAQPSLSSTRVVESGDAVANLIGIAAAALVLMVGLGIMRWIFGDDREYYGDQVHQRHDTTDEMFLPQRR